MKKQLYIIPALAGTLVPVACAQKTAAQESGRPRGLRCRKA